MKQYVVSYAGDELTITIALGEEAKVVTVFDQENCLYAKSQSPCTSDADCIADAHEFMRDYVKSRDIELGKEVAKLREQLKQAIERERLFGLMHHYVPRFLEALEEEVSNAPIEKRSWDFKIKQV